MANDVDYPILHLRVAAEADPGAISRVLERFTNLNVVPRRVLAEWATTGTLHVQVEVGGVSEDMFSLITGKIAQVPSVLHAYWHR